MKKAKLGKYKIAYLYPHEQDILGSEMFDTLADAKVAASEAESSGTPFLLMRLAVHGDGEYYWRVLPYGAHRPLTFARTLYNLRLPLLVGAAATLAIAASRFLYRRRKRAAAARESADGTGESA